jgi:hypothetical protein
MTNAERLELGVLEYIRGLEGLGLGQKAWALYLRAQTRDIRPLLLRQRAEIERAVRTETPENTVDVDAEIEAAWRRLQESLKTLWLTEGPHTNEEDAA